MCEGSGDSPTSLHSHHVISSSSWRPWLSHYNSNFEASLLEWMRICASLLSFVFICIVIGDQERMVYIPSYLFACSSQDLDFQRHLLWSFLFSVSSVKMRGNILFRWYWRNWWPSLFISWYFHSQNINH